MAEIGNRNRWTWGLYEPPLIVRTVQKKRPARGRISRSKTGLAKRERRQASLCLEPLVVVEVDELIDQVVGLLKHFQGSIPNFV